MDFAYAYAHEHAYEYEEGMDRHEYDQDMIRYQGPHALAKSEGN